MERVAGVAVRGGPCVEHQCHARCKIGEGAYQIDAATVGQAVVDDGDIGPELGDRFLPVPHSPDGREDLETRVVQKVAQQLAKLRVVLDEADRHRGRGCVKERYRSHKPIMRDRRGPIPGPKDLSLLVWVPISIRLGCFGYGWSSQSHIARVDVVLERA
jgi:hypothetical protein